MTPFSLPDITFCRKTITKEVFEEIVCLCSSAVYSLSINSILNDYFFPRNYSFLYFYSLFGQKSVFKFMRSCLINISLLTMRPE